MRRAWLFCLLAACNALPGKPTEADRPLRPAEVVDFSQLYAENCAGCHGADGTLGGARPLNDAVYLQVAGRDSLRQATADGIPSSLMPGFSTTAGGMLTEQQIDIIVDGMLAKWARNAPRLAMPAPPYASAAPGDAERGTAAYTTYCASCHGPNGKGGEKARSIVDGSYLALVSDQALRSTVIFGRIDLGMPNWSADAARPMSDQDVNDVVAWLIAQRPQFPGQPYGQ